MGYNVGVNVGVSVGVKNGRGSVHKAAGVSDCRHGGLCAGKEAFLGTGHHFQRSRSRRIRRLQQLLQRGLNF